MPLIINGQKYDDENIAREAERMRPQYEQMLREEEDPGSPEEQEARLYEWARENVVEMALLRHAAMTEGPAVEQAALDERVEAIQRQYTGDEAFQQFIADEANAQLFREDIEAQMRVELYVAQLQSKVEAPSDAEVEQYYADNREEFIQPERVHAKHIVIHAGECSTADAIQTLEKAKARVDGGEEFETVADELSNCPGNGGDLGWFPRGEMVPAFEDRAFAMEPGEVSEIFESDFGHHLVKLYGRQAEEPVPFAEVKDAIRNRILEERGQEMLEEFLDQQREKATIEYRAPEPGESE